MEIFVPLILASFLFVFGATIGSFLNVVIYRTPRGESVVNPPSHCPRCGRTLTARENIPLLSWLQLKGRCRTCGIRISPRYFGVELLTAILFVAAGWDPAQPFVPSLTMLHKLILVTLAVPIIFIDQDHRIVPDELSVPFILTGFAWNIVAAVQHQNWLVTLDSHEAATRFDMTLPNSLVFAMICAGIFWLIQWFGEVVFRREAMGLGDVNIAAGIGANLPLLGALCSFGIAIGLGALVGVVCILRRRRDRMLAFGPMLMAGALLMLLFPDPVYHFVDWYRWTLSH